MKWTKENRKEYDRQRYQDLKILKSEQKKARQLEMRKKLQEYKSDKFCIRCGYSEHPAALQFHHRDSSQKSFNISDAASNAIYSWHKILQEIEKCDIICANCHAIEHSKIQQSVGESSKSARFGAERTLGQSQPL